MRPEILFPLFAPTSVLKGVGERVAPLLEKVAGPIVRDVAFLPPSGLVRRTPTTVAQVREGEVQTLLVTVEGHQKPGRRDLPWRIRCYDGTGFLTLIWFKGHGDHLIRGNPVGAKRAVSGKVERYGSEIQMVHPDYVLPEEKLADIPELETVYPATAGLPSRTIRKLALEALERCPALPEWQDPAWLASQKWPSWRDSLELMHHPASEADIAEMARHRRRLAYDELLAHQLALAQRKAARRAHPAPVIGDIAEALDSAKAVGDDRIQQRSGQGVDSDGWTHGSSEQRMAWFTRGYEEGSLEACDTFSASRL